MAISTGLGSATFRRWVAAVEGEEIPTGLSVDEAIRRAKAIWRRLQDGSLPAFDTVTSPEFADEIHALCRVITREEGRPEQRLQSLAGLYGGVKQLSWPGDTLGEQTDLLTKISYLAWLHARRQGRYPELMSWEKVTIGHVLEQQSAKDFLALRSEARSQELSRRFLGDTAVLLAACARLKEMIEASPLMCVRDAALTHKWVSENWRTFPSREESQYFAAELAWIMAAASRHCGRYRDCQMWLNRLGQSCDEIAGAEVLRARATYIRLAALHDLRSYAEVVGQLPALKETFLRLGMRLYFAKSCLLYALTLKETGHDDKARLELAGLRRDPAILGDQCLLGLVVVSLAELEGRLGRFDAAMANLSVASDLLRGAGTPLVVGHLHAVKGELLRDKGLLLAAVRSYCESIRVYSSAGMSALAAYLRIVLAETLLAAGREDEAILEIITALPTIGESGLVREAMAAIVLLRESVRRHKVDPSALHELREQLERMKNGGEL